MNASPTNEWSGSMPILILVSSYPGTQQFYLSYKQPAGAQQLPNRLFIFMEQIDGWCPAGSLFDLHEKNSPKVICLFTVLSIFIQKYGIK